MKPTPGPWVASGNGVHFGTQCVATTHMEPREQRQADASLIAAAPDLLDACKEALNILESLQGGCTDSDDGTVEAITVWSPEVIEALIKAIAKATGEQQ